MVKMCVLQGFQTKYFVHTELDISVIICCCNFADGGSTCHALAATSPAGVSFEVPIYPIKNDTV